MEKFLFNTYVGDNNDSVIEIELPSVEAVRQEAVNRFGELLTSALAINNLAEQWRVDVTDLTGRLLFSLYFVGTDAPAIGPSSDIDEAEEQALFSGLPDQ